MATMQSITPAQAQVILNKNEAVLIDVRENDEFEKVHIEGAILTPLSTLPQSIQDIDFDAIKDKKIIFQCLKGGRSAQAIYFLQDSVLKELDVYNLEGGILAWIDEDLPIVTNAAP
jgi:rhodanese-related sulfurtransferase